MEKVSEEARLVARQEVATAISNDTGNYQKTMYKMNETIYENIR